MSPSLGPDGVPGDATTRDATATAGRAAVVAEATASVGAGRSFDPLPADRRLATGVAGWLGRLAGDGWLEAADVHVADRLGSLVDESDELAVVTLALTVRAAREGSTCLDLAHATAILEAAAAGGVAAGGPLPEEDAWAGRVERSRLAAASVLRVEHGLVYLDRYWREEQQVARDLRTRSAHPIGDVVDGDLLDAGLDRVFPGPTWQEQRDAVRAAVARPTTILTGGPGTGKTSTVAGLVALLAEQQELAGGRPSRVVLAAPTGRAAARLRESVLDAASRMGPDDRRRLETVESSTVHRLLGWARSSTRFRHDRGNPLPHDVVVVDEASMLSLTLTARLLEAVRPAARLVLVGDPDQLASVEAGAVLADLVAGLTDDVRSPVSALRTSHRFGPAIGALAAAIRDGRADEALEALRGDDPSVRLVELPGDLAHADPERDADPGRAERPEVVELTRARTRVAEQAVRPVVLAHALRLRELAAGADADAATAAVAALGEHRLLCAHREGPWGVRSWVRRVEQWLAEATGDPSWHEHHVGQPLLVTRNDPALGLFNGDPGVVVARGGRLIGAFDAAGGVVEHAVSRLADVESAHALTVHKSQGSQARAVTVLLPDVDSRLLTRELLYTAVTRAREEVVVVGTEVALRAAVERRTQRASGLARSLTTPIPIATP